jgi:hypothetical protein
VAVLDKAQDRDGTHIHWVGPLKQEHERWSFAFSYSKPKQWSRHRQNVRLESKADVEAIRERAERLMEDAEASAECEEGGGGGMSMANAPSAGGEGPPRVSLARAVKKKADHVKLLSPFKSQRDKRGGARPNAGRPRLIKRERNVKGF